MTALAVTVSLASALLTILTTTQAVSAADPCGPSGNAISCENSKPGTPRSVWDIGDAGDTDIQGFSTDVSVNVGSTVSFKVDTTARAYSIKIFRMGWYNGDGARQVDTVTPSAALPQTQPQCITDATTELYDCGNWGVSASWNVPTTAVSGVYEALLTRTDNGHASAITFVVRDNASHSAIIYQTSDPTWQAYNTYGGSDFYQGAANGRAYKISYNRPVLTRGGIGGRDFFYSNEYPMVEFLERNGYDVSYQSGVDTDRFGSLLTNHKTFMSIGHDEYWSTGQRANVEAARAAGVNLAFFSGNEVYWHTRYEPSADASHTDYRTLVSYKETWSNAKIDPSSTWTGTWRDPRFAPKSAGAGVPENALTGTAYMANSDDLTMQVPASMGGQRLWRNTNVASAAASGQTASLAPHTIGYESDEDLDNGARPAGLIRLSLTTGSTPQYLTDFGSTVVPGTTTHAMTLYRAPSGALVFGAGTIQFTWGLDANHDSPFAAQPADPAMQQFTVNLLAEMSAQPTTLQAGLVAAVKSTDTTGPTVSIASPTEGAATANGTSMTVSGSASDVGGSVAGVEVSTDGGSSWHPATGTSTWSYTYIQHGVGTTPIKVRAMDDSANIGAVATRNLTVTCPCTVFGPATPATPAASDTSAVEVGMRFTPKVDGVVNGVRFYKGSGNTGTHVGTLWSSTGAKLASVIFANESATGWQTATFTAPVTVTSGTTYVVSYTAPAGRYAADTDGFSSAGIDAYPLGVVGGYGATPAGVYANPGLYPNSSFQNTNYYVDPIFTDLSAAALTASSQFPLDGSSSVSTGTSVSAVFSKAVTSASLSLKDVNGAAVAGTTTYDAASRTVTFKPSSALNGFVKYTATLGGLDAQGNQVTTGKTWSFTSAKPTNAPNACPCSLFGDNVTPTTLENPDSAVTLGVRFASSTAGTVTGIRFYKGVNNTGTHTGTLWSIDGTVIATGTFTNESTSGWQDLTFPTPVSISANTEYVASYRTTVGNYSSSANAFAASDLSRAPLRVDANSGMYTYSAGFPGTTTSTNYLVDVVFQPAAAGVTLISTSPANAATGVARDTTIAATFSAAISSGATMSVTSGGSSIAGTTALSPDGTTLTFTPSATLPADADVTAMVSGATPASGGTTLATQTWTFHTKSATAAADENLFGNVTPTITSNNDSSAVELGTAFTPAVNGTVKAVRFYKGTGNLGTHTGSIWSSAGVRLATVTFTGETATGWQTATLASPLAVTAGTTYVVSYYAPQGHYASTANFFATPTTSGSLTAPAANNGRYLYATGGGYPSFSFNATNYFVDVVFNAGGTTTPPPAPTISVTGRTPAANATNVVRTTAPTITFSTPIAAGATLTAKNGTANVAGTTTLSTDKQTLTFTPSATLPASSTITMTASGVVGANGATLPTDSWSFATAAPTVSTASLFASSTPTSTTGNMILGSEFGTTFVPSTSGTVTAVRFFKSAAMTGTHTGSIWSSTGVRLATVTYAGETASGWQQASLTTPLAVTAGTTYVVSYFSPNGRYVSTSNFFPAAGSFVAGVLSAPTSGNGVYRLGSSNAPTTRSARTNFFADVVLSYTS